MKHDTTQLDAFDATAQRNLRLANIERVQGDPMYLSRTPLRATISDACPELAELKARLASINITDKE